jgi:hypothetical protein
MSGFGTAKAQKGDARGGRFFLLPFCVIRSEAFRTASPRAIKLLFALCCKHNGFNNGAIGLSFRELADMMDSQNHGANGKALRELIQRGFVTVEKIYPRGQRLANEYRLTFVSTSAGAATNDYIHWTPGDAGTRHKGRGPRKTRAATSATRTRLRVVEITTGGETSRCEIRNAVHAKSTISAIPPVADVAAHIGLPSVGLCRSASDFCRDGSLSASAAPDPDELRKRVNAVLESAGRGSQEHLAALASIRPAALSKFLHKDGTLNDRSRTRLTLALPRVAGRRLERTSA